MKPASALWITAEGMSRWEHRWISLFDRSWPYAVGFPNGRCGVEQLLLLRCPIDRARPPSTSIIA